MAREAILALTFVELVDTLVEDFDGSLGILHWADERLKLGAEAAA